MIEFQFRPIERWPGEPTRARRRSQFNTAYSKTLQLLERELEFLRARQIVIQADCTPSEIRRDGQLRSDARLKGPGIILTFESKHGPLQYPCDSFTDWQDNLRAIALALEALRAVDRYGATRRAEQYKGWAKLAAPPSGPFASVREAAMWITSVVGVATASVLESPIEWRSANRSAAALLHPDGINGSDERFKRLQAAKELLDRHHGL